MSELYGRKPAIDEKRAVSEHLELASAATAVCEEGFDVLKIVVISFDGWGDGFISRNRRAILDGDDPDGVGASSGTRGEEGGVVGNGGEGCFVYERADVHRTKPIQLRQFVLPERIRLVFVQAVNGGLRQNYKLRRVDRINPFAKNGPLPPSLPLFTEERVGVLKLIALHSAPECLLGFQRRAVFGVHITNAAFRYAHQRHAVDAVLPGKEAEVNATSQHAALHPSLIGRRNDPSLGKRSAGAPELFYESHPCVRDVDNPQKARRVRQGRDY